MCLLSFTIVTDLLLLINPTQFYYSPNIFHLLPSQNENIVDVTRIMLF